MSDDQLRNVHQHIDGEGNFVAGRDLVKQIDVHNEGRRPIFSPNDPNVVDCPFGCGQRTWFNAERCWNCDQPVSRYFNQIAQQERQQRWERLNFRMVITIAALATLGGISMMWFSEQLFSKTGAQLGNVLGRLMFFGGILLSVSIGLKLLLRKIANRFRW